MYRLIINSRLQNLRHEALRTIPYEPSHFEMVMLAGKGDSTKMSPIIQDSTMIAGYNPEKNIFVPFDFDLGDANQKNSIMAEDIKSDGTFNGKRINRIEIHGYGNVKESFENFRDNYLKTIIKNGYNIEYGSISHIASSRKKSWLILEPDGLTLKLETTEVKEFEENMINWFNKLVLKYA